MMGIQREVLASLGIDLWVPDFLPSQQNVATSIWRDQNATEIISENCATSVSARSEKHS